ncbi:MAG TPA: alpha/beta fold hydrolase [Myxococcales bacterium]|jgi:pimeloyl-ACP methyl ester carboxylesterase|nr:alpha/beta fold hydrolase [Myxococcales bacterium]
MILPFSAVLWAGHALYRAQGFSARTLQAAGRRVLLYERPGAGTGPKVLLVHGLGGNAASWLKLVPALSRCCSGVAVVDLPGHGRASLVAGEGPLGTVELAQALGVALAEVAAPGRPVLLVGNSLGGALCLNAAALAPELVAAVVGLSPAGAPLTRAERAALLRAFGGGRAGGISEMARRLYHRPPRSLWFFSHALTELWGSPPVQHVLAQVPDDASPALAPALLEQVAQPALILWGDSDGILPASSVPFFRAHLRNGTVEIIERCGHVPQLERPEVVGPRIARFVAGLPRAPPVRAESA